MQIIYAAPFLLLAAILFTVLSLIPRLRRFAISVPTGAVAAGPGALIAYILFVLIRSKLWGNDFPADRWDAVAFVVGALVSAILAGLVTQMLLYFLPTFLLRIIVFSGAACSYFVLLIGSTIGIHAWVNRGMDTGHSATRGMLMFWSGLILSCGGAWFISRYAGQFRRPQSIQHEASSQQITPST
jgi:hypothetical protein